MTRQQPTTTKLKTSSLSVSMMMTTLWLMAWMMAVGGNVTGKELRVAWLAPKDMCHGSSAATSVNTLKVALRVSELQVIHGYSVRLKWYDSQCDGQLAQRAAEDARRDFDPDLILGPPSSEGMKGVAKLASQWNLPVFGWVSNSHELSDRHTYSTLIRVLGPLNKFSDVMSFAKSLLRWDRFAMIYDTDTTYRSVHNAIATLLRRPDGGNTVPSIHGVHPDKPDSEIREIFLQIRKYARVIILSVPWLSMRKYMLVAHELGMTSGDFAFICINGDVYSPRELQDDVQSDKVWRRNDAHDEAAKAAFEAVIYVMLAQLEGPNYSRLEQLVKRAETFDVPRWELPKSNNTYQDAYAPFLYDATLTWASLVNMTVEANRDPRNGTALFRLAQGISTDGVTGGLMLDVNADRLVNNWILDMGPDGHFRICFTLNNRLTGSTLIMHHEIRWPDGRTGNKNAPLSTPLCGFDGQLCKNAILSSVTASSQVDDTQTFSFLSTLWPSLVTKRCDVQWSSPIGYNHILFLVCFICALCESYRVNGSTRRLEARQDSKHHDTRKFPGPRDGEYYRKTLFAEGLQPENNMMIYSLIKL